MEMATDSNAEKPVMVVAIDESEHSLYVLKWALNHFFVPFAPNYPFKLLLLHAKPFPSVFLGFSGSGLLLNKGASEALPIVNADLKRKAARIIQKGKELCNSKSVNDVAVEVIEGDARNVLCEAVEKHHASMLVVGSHGYGTIKRAFLGSVSAHCAHHANCSVMIVKMPQIKR